MVEPGRRENFVSNKYGYKARGNSKKFKKSMPKHNHKRAAKSKCGKEPGQVQSGSSQLGIKELFELMRRPESVRCPIPMGIGSSLHKPAMME